MLSPEQSAAIDIAAGIENTDRIAADQGSQDFYSVDAGYLMGTAYESEFLTIKSAHQSALEAANALKADKKRALAIDAANQAYYDSVQSLYSSIREREQSSIENQTREKVNAGYNPFLTGDVDSAAAATAGRGHDTLSPHAEFPAPFTGEQVIPLALNALSVFAGLGTSIASTVMSVGKIASDIALSEGQTENLRLARSAYIQQQAEQFVIDTAPTFDDGLQAFPAWSPASISYLSDSDQSEGLRFAKAFYGSDRHRRMMLGESVGVESQRNALAHLYGSGFYSNSMGVMSERVAHYAKLHLDYIESEDRLKTAYNEYYKKYVDKLSPELMADVENAVLTSQKQFYDIFDAGTSASAANVQNQTLSMVDAVDAAAAQNSLNRYNSALYDTLDANAKALYDNAYNELMTQQLELEKLLVNTENIQLESLRKDLDSPDPSVRISAAKSIERVHAKSNYRASATGWQRFSQGVKDLVGSAATVAGVAVGAGALAAGKTAAAAVSPIMMPNYSNYVQPNDPMSYGL